MKIDAALFQTLGLSTSEVQIYLAALELGESTVQELARKSGIKRTSIYNFIDKLKDRQILTETKRNKRSIFSATNPHRLVELGKIRIRELEHFLPQLLAINNRSLRKPRVTFHEGIEGIKEIYNDMLQERRPIIGWSDQKHMWPILGKEYCESFPPERAKRGISLQIIANDTTENRKFSEKDKELLRETKFISSESDLRTEINIYGDKVLLASFRSHPAFAVLVEDKDIAETLRVTWKELWKRL